MRSANCRNPDHIGLVESIRDLNSTIIAQRGDLMMARNEIKDLSVSNEMLTDEVSKGGGGREINPKSSRIPS